MKIRKRRRIERESKRMSKKNGTQGRKRKRAMIGRKKKIKTEGEK